MRGSEFGPLKALSTSFFFFGFGSPPFALMRSSAAAKRCSLALSRSSSVMLGLTTIFSAGLVAATLMPRPEEDVTFSDEEPSL